MKRVIVTGGSGFIGTQLISCLLEQGHRVLNLDKATPLNASQNSFHRRADILDAAELQAEFDSFCPEWLFHLAARADCDRESTTVELGYPSQHHWSDQCSRRCGYMFVVGKSFGDLVTICLRPGYQPSRDEDYSPHTVYGWSKVETERAVRAASLKCPWVIVRPTNIWGPWHMRYRVQVWRAIRRGFYLHPGGPAIIRSYGYVGNVARQMVGLMAADAKAVAGRVFYVGDPPRDLCEWVNGFSQALRGRPVTAVPRPLLRTIGLTGDLITQLRGREFLIHSSRYRSMVTSDTAPMAATYALLGPSLIPLDKGVDETVRWLRTFDGHDGLRF